MLLLCPIHHDVIDADVESYTVERLQKMKHDAETTVPTGELSDQVAQQLISISDTVVAGSVISSIGQAGGQTAHTITNLLVTPAPPTDILPLLKRQWSLAEPTLSTLQIRLRNAGGRQPQRMKLHVAFPGKYIRHELQSGESPRDQFTRYFDRRNDFFVDQQIFEQLYPGEVTRQIVLEVHYFTEAPAISAGDSVDITLRADDSPEFHANIPLTTIEKFDNLKWYEISRSGEICERAI